MSRRIYDTTHVSLSLCLNGRGSAFTLPVMASAWAGPFMLSIGFGWSDDVPFRPWPQPRARLYPTEDESQNPYVSLTWFGVFVQLTSAPVRWPTVDL